MEAYYDLLEIWEPDQADSKLIKKQFKKIALLNHPDKGGSTEAMARINHAHAVLSDPDRRARYDKFGIDWPDATTDSQSDENGEKQPSGEDQKMMENIKLTMEPIGNFLMVMMFGSAYIWLMQYFWTQVLISIFLLAIIFFANAPEANTRLAILLAVGWVARQGEWCRFFVESFILWCVIFIDSGSLVVTGGGALVCLFIAWWFSGRFWCYLIAMLLAIAVYLAIWLVLFVSVAGRKEAAEQQLEKHTSEIKPKIRALKKENKNLKQKIKDLESKLAKK
mmetsp:Transcript_4148/g.7622  ORF Transcript_4148/g.7622 Transcript_4148/m.7622 type:complete len:279 (-) Transcript_4148:18-854(-)